MGHSSEKQIINLFRPLEPKQFHPKEVWGFDIETAGDMNDFTLAVFVNDTQRIECRTKQEAKEFLQTLDPSKNCMVATNLSFDFLGVFDLSEHSYYKIADRNGTIYSIAYYRKTTTHNEPPLWFYDTVRYFPASVEVLGKISGIPKLAHPSCFAQIPSSDTEWKELTEYCANDAYISYYFFKHFVLRYLQKHKLPLRNTIAAISMLDYRTHYLKEIIPVEGPEIHSICFRSYYGGRTETFKRGSVDELEVYDFNSLYPSVMQYDLPDPRSGYTVKQVSLYDIMNKEGACYIEGYQDDCHIPVLPVRTETKLLFPKGKIKGYYTFVELRYALQHGLGIDIYGEGVVYTKSKPFLRDFVVDKYNTRLDQKAKGDPLELMTKLIMNSLYGKFGFKYMNNSTVLTEKELTKDICDNAKRIEDLGNGFFCVDSEATKPPAYSFPIWASYITSYARIKLHIELDRYKDRVCYCDTDSIFLIKDTSVQIDHSNRLGDLGHEYDCSNAIIVRPKCYFTKGMKLKGVKGGKTKEEFIDIMKGIPVMERRFIRYRTALRSKAHHKFGIVKPNQIIPHQKIIKSEDSKRIWPSDFNIDTLQESVPLDTKDIDDVIMYEPVLSIE